MVVRRRLSNETALKRLYVSMELSSTFMPALPSPYDGVRKGRGTKGGKSRRRGNAGGYEGGGKGGGGKSRASGSKDNAASISRTTVVFAVVAQEFTDVFDGKSRDGVVELKNGEAHYIERVASVHHVEYERRHYGDQVHHRLTKGWWTVCLILGARVGDTLEMTRYIRKDGRLEDDQVLSGEQDGGERGEGGGNDYADDGAASVSAAAAAAAGTRNSMIYIRVTT